ncbi:MAG TPA: hypothetical protein VIY27_05775 [Myxococcota bacterium]
MRRVWLIALAATLFAACASGKKHPEITWIRDDGTPADRVQLQRDNATCRNDAGFPSTTAEDEWVYRYKNCMRSLGWLDVNAAD